MATEVEKTIKQMWMPLAADLYGSTDEAEQAWNRLASMVRQKQREETLAQRRAAAERRADREARAYRGRTTVVSTCGVCGTQHPGEC